MASRDLLLFTTSFPYGTVTEASFIMTELPHLCGNFRRVIIVPEIQKGSPVDLSQFHNITVDTSRITSIDHRHPASKLLSALHPDVLLQTFRSLPHLSPSQWPAAWSMAINRHRIGRNLCSIIRSHNIDINTTVFYTFWFDHITEAIALTLPPYSGTLISCTHRHDLYPGTLKIPYYRSLALQRMTRLYTVSRGGHDYMIGQHPDRASKILIRTLGSSKRPHDLLTPPTSAEEPYTFLSCSRVDDNKRVILNLRFISILALHHTSRQFRWIHIGDGPSMPQLRAAAGSQLPPNLSVELKGALSNADVHHIYRTTHVDWFMLLSRQEGNPIAVAEALSYGVPVITCDVPGCREIADDSVGLQLPPEPDEATFHSRITPFVNGTASQTPLRETAFARWSANYDADTLRARFASEIADL